MKITLDVDDVKIDIPKHIKKVRSPKMWKFAAQQWHRLYKDYVPMRTGVLYNQVIIKPNLIIHTAPYAHYMYEGRLYGPNYPIVEGGRVVGYFSQRGRPKKPTFRMLKFSKEQHLKATRKWDKAATPTQGPKLVKTMQKYIDGGRIDLDGK